MKTIHVHYGYMIGEKEEKKDLHLQYTKKKIGFFTGAWCGIFFLKIRCDRLMTKRERERKHPNFELNNQCYEKRRETRKLFNFFSQKKKTSFILSSAYFIEGKKKNERKKEIQPKKDNGNSN